MPQGGTIDSRGGMGIELTAGPMSRGAAESTMRDLIVPEAPCLPAGMSFEGEAHIRGNYTLKGRLMGSLQLPASGMLLVTGEGSAEGSLRAGNVVIAGEVEGAIDCRQGAVEFAASARCTVTVRYRELTIARGASVDAELKQTGSRYG